MNDGFITSRDEMVRAVSSKIKLVRVERGFSQEKMADVLGISKKTLVQIEKERISCGWTVCVAVCSLFRESEVLQSSLGGDPLEVVQAISDVRTVGPKEKTWGGKVWWKTEKQAGGFCLQRNIVSGHYRILDKENYRWCSSFDRAYMLETLRQLTVDRKQGSEIG